MDKIEELRKDFVLTEEPEGGFETRFKEIAENLFNNFIIKSFIAIDGYSNIVLFIAVPKFGSPNNDNLSEYSRRIKLFFIASWSAISFALFPLIIFGKSLEYIYFFPQFQ